MLPTVTREFNLFSNLSVFLNGLFLIVGLSLALLLGIFYRIKKGLIPRSLVIFSLIFGLSALFLTSILLTVLQYHAFMGGPIKYAMPPYKPLSEYFLGYVFFSYWSFWIVGLVIASAVSIYWWVIKQQSNGQRISTEEILIFILFGGLAGWPAVMMYVLFVFVFYISALVCLNVINMTKVQKSFFGRLRSKFISQEEIRIPIMPFFLLAAPLALWGTPIIFKALGLINLYIAPRLIAN